MKIYNFKLKVENGFSLMETLECGQFFRYKKINNEDYDIVVKNFVANIKQISNTLNIKTNCSDRNFFINFFDLDMNYKTALERIKKNEVLKNIIKANTLRILNQDPFEVIISFILSQNNNIKRIQKNVNDFCQIFGKKIVFENEIYFSFPTSDEFFSKLNPKNKEKLRNIKLGYRVDYLLNLNKEILKIEKMLMNLSKASNKYYKNVNKTLENKKDFAQIENLSQEVAKKLSEIKGVGKKVSDCILLFSGHALFSFPIDTWIKKVLTDVFKIDAKDTKKIKLFIEGDFASYAGIAQQYLFHFYKNK